MDGSATDLEFEQLQHHMEKLLDEPSALFSHDLSVADDVSERESVPLNAYGGRHSISAERHPPWQIAGLFGLEPILAS